jgi:3-oxoacyl-[acyl-carrier-protein] synthase-3
MLLEAMSVGADGSLAELLQIPAGGSLRPPSEETVAQRLHYIQMQGRETFKHAVRHMEAVGRACLAKADISAEELSWVVPHQANSRIIDAVSARFGLTDEKVYKTVHKYGNSSASAIALALEELLHEHPMGAGERVLLVAFGAGLTWAGALLTKED